MSTDRYQSPLSERYASKENAVIFLRYEVPGHGESFGSHWRRLRKSFGLTSRMSRSQS